MRQAIVVGAGQVPFGKTPDRTLEEMGRQALLRAVADAGITVEDIAEVYSSNVFGGMLTGQRVLRDLGLTGIPITNVENACSSGSSALRDGAWAVASGRADVVLVLGVEKLSALGGGTLPLETTDIEVAQGQVMPSVYAMRARRYMHETGATVEDLAQVAVKARRNGSLNPDAQFRRPVTVDDVLASRMVADPLRLFMCCPTGDGVAAVVVCAAERAAAQGQAADAGEALGRGLARLHRRARTASTEALAAPDVDRLHRARRRWKEVGYVVAWWSPAWPRALTAWLDDLDEVLDLLGRDHDQAVLRERIGSWPDGAIDGAGLGVPGGPPVPDPATGPALAPGSLAAAVARSEHRSARLRGRALPRLARLTAEPTGAFVARHVAYLRSACAAAHDRSAP